MTKIPKFSSGSKETLENKINENSGYRRGNWVVENNELSKKIWKIMLKK